MGFKGFTSNRKKKSKSSKSDKWHRALKAEKKKQLPAASLIIEDVHLFSKDKLKNKLKNPQNNIKISGKKQRRLTKRLGHSLKEKSRMDVEPSEPKPKRKAEVPKAAAIEEPGDAVMAEVSEVTQGAAATTSTRRKRNRGGKKHKKKESVTEDVDMEEEDL